jgi:hypothetical protein
VIGQVLGHCRVVAKIGEGGMGVVYRAFDEVLHRDVALKVVKKDDRLDTSASQRLLHEARASSSLAHPNICTIHEVGENEGELYIVMGRSKVEIETSPATLGDALAALWTLYPGVRDRIATEQGQVREHVTYSSETKMSDIRVDSRVPSLLALRFRSSSPSVVAHSSDMQSQSKLG